jgi:tetratricopeptide (TPR) repeat protein
MAERQTRGDRSRSSAILGAGPRGVRIAAALIAAVVALAYANSFRGPFILDDIPNIVQNPGIRSLWPPARLYAGAPVGIAGRPLVGLSLALNYAASGESVWSYHVFNLLIHMLAALTLLGILRRTLLTDRLRETFGAAATPVAAAAALIWAVHPLQTQAVTYIIQRCESMMGLFFLLTFYCAIRGWQADRPRRWHAAAIVAFLGGVGSKEVIAAAPPLVFLYDLMFEHRSARGALRSSAVLYAGLLAGLVLLGIEVRAAGVGALGLERLSITPAQYAVTQPQVVLHYLQLALWPHPLVLDYQWPIAQPSQAIVPGLVLLVLLAATIGACLRSRSAGFPGAWFFVILAPTSSVIPIRDLAFEHRMYLPLAGVVTLAVAGAYALVRPRVAGDESPGRVPRARGRGLLPVVAGAGALLAIGLGFLTFERNRDYRSELSIWTDTVRKRPLNAGAHLNLGAALLEAGRTQEAREHTERAARLNPGSAEAKNNLGCMLARQGELDAALGYLQEAARVDPGYAEAQYNLGNVLYQAGRFSEAATHYRRALDLRPDYVDARRNLGQALQTTGRLEEAAACFRQVLQCSPKDAQTHNALGMVLLGAGRLTEALASFRAAARLDPGWVAPQNGAAWILATHPDPAVRDAGAAIRMAQGLDARTGHENPGILDTLAAAYAAGGRFEEAIRTAERAASLASASGSEDTAAGIRQRLMLYRQGRPFVCAAR